MAVSAWRVLDGQSLTLYGPDNLQSTTLQRTSTTLTISSPVSITGSLTVSSGTITGDGSGLTNLNASNLTTGTVPAARLSNAVLIAPSSTQTITYQGPAVSTILKMAASPTANPFAIQNSAGSTVFAIDPTGAITTGTIPWGSVSSKPTFVNSLTAGAGIQLSGSTGSITITNTGILSLQAGSGISVSGTNPAIITNTDPGSAQPIFKNIGDGTTTKFSASSNNDTLHLVAGTDITLTWDAADKKVTIAAANMRPLAGTGISVADRTVSVNFAGTGTATTVARSDHNHDAVYAKLTGNTNLSGTHVFTATQDAIRLTPATDPTQEITDELITLTGTTPAALAYKPVHAGSEVVRSQDGAITYVRDQDYTIVYWTGAIARTANSSIPSGATVRVSYTHTKKLFRITDPTNSTDKFGIDTEGNIYGSSITVQLSAASEETGGTTPGDFAIQGNLEVAGSSTLGNDSTDSTSIFGSLSVNAGTPTSPTPVFSVDPVTGNAVLTGALTAGELLVGDIPVALDGHTHDDRYFTESELANPGGGGAVHWNNVTNKPTFVNSLAAGTGISLSGSTGSVTINNTDRGSSQAIFKQIADATGAVKFSATSNNDTLRFAAGGSLSVSFDPANKQITYSFTESVDVDSITAGPGISVNQSTGHVTITNTDRGSSQNIFKNIGDGTTTRFSASSNNDTFHLVAGTNISLSWDTANKKVTIAGTGTWPNADTVDNRHASEFVLKAGDTMTGPLRLAGQHVQINRPDTTGGWARGLHLHSKDGSTTEAGIGFYGSGDAPPQHLYIGFGSSPWSTSSAFTVSSSSIAFKGNTVWHAGNDGSGSGLDADLLDGQQGSYYLNASNLTSGNLNIARMPTGGNWDLTSNLTIEANLLTLDITNARVGVGTATPAYKLDVSGDVRWTGTLQGGSVPWARLTGVPDASSSAKGVMQVGTGLTASSGLVSVSFPSASTTAGWSASAARSDHFHPGLHELPGPGVVSGFAVSAHAVPDLGVQVSSGVAILRDGYRFELTSAADVALNGFVSGTGARYAVIYLLGTRQANPNDQIGVAPGPADGSLALPALPDGAIPLAKVLLEANDVAITPNQVTDIREFSPIRLEITEGDAALTGRATRTYGDMPASAWRLDSAGRLTLYGPSAGISTDGGSTYVNLSAKAAGWDRAVNYYHRHVYDLPQLDMTDPFQRRYLLAYEPAPAQPGDAFPKRLMVFKNGLLMRPQRPGESSGYDYTVSGNAITFVQAPVAGDVILAFYEIVPES